TYRANHSSPRIVQADIRDVDAKRLLKEVSLRSGELDLLAGCPPCQGFSRLPNRNRNTCEDDERNDLIFEFIRFVKVFRPKAVMLENVPRLSLDARFTQAQAQLSELGYSF